MTETTPGTAGVCMCSHPRTQHNGPWGPCKASRACTCGWYRPDGRTAAAGQQDERRSA